MSLLPSKIKRGFIHPETGKIFDRYFYRKGVARECWKSPELFAVQQAEISRKQKLLRANPKFIERRAANWKEWYAKNRHEKRAYDNRYKRENKTILREKRLAWIAANPEHVRQLNIRSKRRTRAKSLEYQRKRYSEDPNFRISRLMRCALWRMAKFGWKKMGKCSEYLGCGFPELRAHIEGQFKPGMSWQNHGAWEMDHKIPLSWFDLTKDEEARKAWHYNNLQPLWRKENRTKNNRYAA